MKQAFRQKQMQSFRWHELLTVVCFFAFFMTISVLTFLLPQQTRSESESRALTERPAVSRVVSVVTGAAEESSGLKERAEQISKITSQTEKYLSDHIPARATLVQDYAEMQLAAGMKQVRLVFAYTMVCFLHVWPILQNPILPNLVNYLSRQRRKTAVGWFGAFCR